MKHPLPLVGCSAIVALSCLACGGEGPADGPSGKGGSSTSTSTSASAGGAGGGGGGGVVTPEQIRIGQFNLREFTTKKLLDEADLQATAAAEIIGRFHADIQCINEMQYDIANIPTSGMPGAQSSATHWGTFDGEAQNARRMADRVHAAVDAVAYPEVLLTTGNSGFYWEGDDFGSFSYTLRGWGEFKGRFNTAVLSRFPILKDQVRVISDFAWEDLPDNKIALLKTEQGMDFPPGFPLFEKSLNIVPLQVGAEVIYLVMLHPTAPVYDPINTYRNYDELRGLRLFLDGQLPGVEPLPAGAKFVVIGDFNADPDPGDGDGIPGAVAQILEQPEITPYFPAGPGVGTKGKNGQYNSYLGGCGLDDGSTVADPKTGFQLQLDYILPSKAVGEPVGGEVFFPDYVKEKEDFDLACRASDHRFVYEDIKLK